MDSFAAFGQDDEELWRSGVGGRDGEGVELPEVEYEDGIVKMKMSRLEDPVGLRREDEGRGGRPFMCASCESTRLMFGYFVTAKKALSI